MSASPTGPWKALITGGASGLGLEVARRFVQQGAGVAIVDIDESGLEKAAEELGPEVTTIRSDARSPSEVRMAIEGATRAPALANSGRGRIVIVRSDAGKRGAPRLHAYSASKFGLIGLAQSLAAELAPAVTVNCGCPVGVPTTGMGQQLLDVKTSETRSSPATVLEEVAAGLPMGRNATAGHVSDAILVFLSDAADFITGVALNVDGGASCGVLPGAAAA